MSIKKRQKTKKESELAGFERRIGVLIESVRDDVKLIAEQYDGIQGDIHDMKGDIAGMKITLDQHTQILDRHTQQLDTHTEMIGSLATNLEIVKEDIGFMKGDLKKKVDIEEFTALERRVAALEKRR